MIVEADGMNVEADHFEAPEFDACVDVYMGWSAEAA